MADIVVGNFGVGASDCVLERRLVVGVSHGGRLGVVLGAGEKVVYGLLELRLDYIGHLGGNRLQSVPRGNCHDTQMRKPMAGIGVDDP